MTRIRAGKYKSRRRKKAGGSLPNALRQLKGHVEDHAAMDTLEKRTEVKLPAHKVQSLENVTASQRAAPRGAQEPVHDAVKHNAPDPNDLTELLRGVVSGIPNQALPDSFFSGPPAHHNFLPMDHQWTVHEPIDLLGLANDLHTKHFKQSIRDTHVGGSVHVNWKKMEILFSRC